jgi:hypothetical protein
MKLVRHAKAILATSAFLMLGLSADLAPAAQAAPGGPGADGPVTPMDCAISSAWYTCNVSALNESGAVISVSCEGESGRKRNSAVPKSDANLANRFMSVATAAILSGRPMRILQDTSTGSECSVLAGCATASCSRAIGFGINK